MRASSLFVLALTGLALVGQAAPPRTFRQWMDGQEVGGSTLETRLDGKVREVRSLEWLELSRMGQEIRQEVRETARKTPDGHLTFTWRLQLSAEPFEGRAEWSPREPGILSIQPSHGAAIRKEIPAGALLWPEDLESQLKDAARRNHSVRATTFSFPVQQWNNLHLEPQGAAPLPGFPDTVRFTGEEREGPATSPVEVWISPTAGEVRQRTELGGLEVLTQRSELPAPVSAKAPGKGFFERTLQTLPPQPFQPWIRELVLRGEGPLPTLPEDAQQTRLSKGRWRLRRAAMPTPAEATQAPVNGTPPPGEARFLAPSPLVQFQDPAFDGLIRRLALPPGLSRWELARRVNAFVFDWITEKDFTVGFASALEVCHHPRGDCTEHGVLAVALLRRLGVPARGVTGWVGLGEVLGLHFWVEVHLRDRWVPIDPTFDQIPASALRIKLGDTDLADLGSVGWEGAALAFTDVKWHLEEEGTLICRGDQVTGPDHVRLRLPGGHWDLQHGVLRLRTAQDGPWQVQAVNRPGEAQLKGASRLAGAQTLRQGWWQPAAGMLWMDLGDGRWLQVEGVAESEAYDLLNHLLAPTSSP
jgi:transglutaminase-like putative cysteine protease